MGNFSTVSVPKTIGKQYSNRVVLYVESCEDLDVLHDRWFRDWSQWIEFQAADAQTGGGGGSTQVFRRVKEDRASNIPAFGIVDRDVFLNDAVTGSSDWIAFLEPDHTAFDVAATNLYSHIKVLRRWEVENYLLHPVAVGKLLRDAEVRSSNVICSPNAAAQCILDFSPVAILVTAANLVLVEHDKEPLSPLFEMGRSDFLELTSCIVQHLVRLGITDPEERIDVKRAAIRAFLRDETGTLEDHWNQLNHLIDGKLFLTRFCKWFGFRDERRLELASKICEHGLIDSEISEFMNMLKQEAIKLIV